MLKSGFLRRDVVGPRAVTVAALWLGHELVATLREVAPVLMVIGAYASVSLIVGPLVHWRGVPSPQRYNEAFWMFAPTLLWLELFITVVLAWHRAPLGLRTIARWNYALCDVRRRRWTPRRVLGAAIMMLAMPMFLGIWNAWKVSVGDVHPFAWDQRLMQWDRLLHFGCDPWLWLHPWFGTPTITRLLDANYYGVWGVLFLAGPTAIALAPPSPLRTQFLTTFTLTWVLLGTIVATVISSAGPVFYSAVVPGSDNPYAPLLSYLRTVDATTPLMATANAETLWSWYRSGRSVSFGGISAMPSMHIAEATLYSLAAWQIHRVLGLAVWIWTILLIASSVYLGWHYALDGYISLVFTTLIWWATSLVLRQRNNPIEQSRL